MSKLTVEEMKAAIYARQCDCDIYTPGIASAEEDEGFGYSGSVEKYHAGKRVLAEHTLRYDHRSTVNCFASGKIPGEDEGESGTLRVEHGYIAASQAWSTAIFNPRK